MTITREQVEAMAQHLDATGRKYLTAMMSAGTCHEAASLLRDLWQRVEAAEARLDYVLSVMRSHGYWAALMTDEEVLAQVDAERGAK